MARFTLPARPTGFTGPDAKLLTLCAWLASVRVLIDQGNKPGNGITDPQMDALCHKETSLLQAVFLQPVPTTCEGLKAKAGVAHALLIEKSAPMTKTPWRDQLSQPVAFCIDTLREMAEAQV